MLKSGRSDEQIWLGKCVPNFTAFLHELTPAHESLFIKG
jgi:hypothetical protein